MKPYSALLSGVFALSTAAFAQNTPAPAPAEFVMRFQPPDGVRMKVSYKLERNRLVDGRPQAQDVAESQTEGVFKRVGAGFEYAPRTVASSMRRNGSPVNDPIATLLANTPVTYVISPEGEATAIKGYGQVETAIKAAVAPQVAAALAPIINEAALAGRERGEWNARYAEFAGGEFAIGDVIDVQAPQQLPNGETLNYTIRTSFPRWEPCPAGQCVRLEQIYESDASALARMANGVVKSVSAAASAPAEALPSASGKGARISGSLTRLIDPRTMLIYAENVRRVITMNLQVPGQGMVPSSQEEIRTYTYSYD